MLSDSHSSVCGWWNNRDYYICWKKGFWNSVSKSSLLFCGLFIFIIYLFIVFWGPGDALHRVVWFPFHRHHWQPPACALCLHNPMLIMPVLKDVQFCVMVNSWGAKFGLEHLSWPSPSYRQEHSQHHNLVFWWDWSVNVYQRLDPDLKASSNILSVFSEKCFNSWLVSSLKIDILFLFWVFLASALGCSILLCLCLDWINPLVSSVLCL